MTETDHIRYDLLAQDALRGVVRRVLADAAKNGLPGAHHFCISFNTRHEGVRMSPRLKEQHPEDITIILQHQFWDLVVKDDHFEVGVSFGGIPERLTVPFEAIKGFFDPAVQFGLQFETINLDAAAEDDRAGEPPLQAGPAAAPAAEAVDPAEEKPSAEVVRIDRFRKK